MYQEKADNRFFINYVDFNEKRTSIDLKASGKDYFFRIDFITNTFNIVKVVNGVEIIKEARKSHCDRITNEFTHFFNSLFNYSHMEFWVVAYFDMLRTLMTFGYANENKGRHDWFRKHDFKMLRRAFGTNTEYAWPNTPFKKNSSFVEKIAKQGLVLKNAESLRAIQREDMDSFFKAKVPVANLRKDYRSNVHGLRARDYAPDFDLHEYLISQRVLKENPYLVSVSAIIKARFPESSEIKIENYVRNKMDFYKSMIVDYKYEPKRLISYMYEDLKWQGITFSGLDGGYDYYDNQKFQIIKDYARMSYELNGNSTCFDKYPKYLKTQHDIVQMNYTVKEDEIKSRNFKEAMTPYANYEEWKNPTYKIVIAKAPADLVKEGTELNHCVASYIDDVIGKRSVIIFLRKKEDEDKCLLTVEIKGKEITQVRGVCNRSATTEEAKALSSFARSIGVEYYCGNIEEAA